MTPHERLVNDVTLDFANARLTRREALKGLGLLGLSATAAGALLQQWPTDAFASRALPRPPADIVNGRSASRSIVWGVNPLVVDGPKLTQMQSLHIGGVVFTNGSLLGMGGGNAWTKALNPTYDAEDRRTGPEWRAARLNQQNDIVHAAHARGMKIYLATHLANLTATEDGAFQLPDIWDDAGWNEYLSVNQPDGYGLVNWASYAKNMGFDGLAFDPEDTAASNGSVQTWHWNYAGNTRSEAATRAKMIERSQAMAMAITSAFPNSELLIYLDTSNDIQDGVDYDIVHDGRGTTSSNLINEWIDGMSSVAPGFKSISLLESIFYKPANFSMDYGVASQYNIGRIYSHVSRSWQRPDLILPKLNVVLFIWFDAGTGDGEGAVSTDAAHTMAMMARSWSTGDSWVLYQQHLMPAPTYALQTKQYEPWASALAGGTATGTVDKNPPMIRAGTSGTGRLDRVSLSGRSGSRITLTFTAAHKYGITHVDYRVFARDGATRLASGVFPMKWNANGGLPTTNYDDAFQEISQTIVAARGTFVLVTAHTGRGQTHSTIVSV
jgi:hypothetical protein